MRELYRRMLELGKEETAQYSLVRRWQKEQVVWELVRKGADQGTVLLDRGEHSLLRDKRTGFKEEITLTESVCRTDRMVICGGGHVSMPIIRLARSVGFHVTVLEDRPLFADNARRAGADAVICESFDRALARFSSDLSTWFVVVTRGHRYDSLCLEQILQKPYAYVGMMGSKRRAAMVKKDLADKGFATGKIEDVHTPIGLAIGAETPEEIAVSVIGQVIDLRSRKKEEANISREFLEKIMEGPCVYTEIIARKGSAPRGVGAKMLVFPDGTTYDTIGGGCAESDVITLARLMLHDKKEDCRLVTVDMTAEQAEEEGMVCGGVISVYMELI